MKNPFKGLGDKIKSRWNKLRMPDEKKAELRKEMIDSFGDGCCIGGLTLLGAAVFAPVAPIPTVIAGALFLTVGGTAKYTASKMKPNGPTLEKALPPTPESKDTPGPLTQIKPAGPDFTRAADVKPERHDPEVQPKFRPDPPPPVQPGR
ncbi:MAG: hypothetical protein EPN97_03750 [Alphaproteobacteria bacterium]|nr:MAG: hypothetical protein EPN97_03750 [Alphaproteobacteria bacterium]